MERTFAHLTMVAAFAIAFTGCRSKVEEAAEPVIAPAPVAAAKPVAVAKPVVAAEPVAAVVDANSDWRWSDEKATLDYCMAKHLPEGEVKRTSFGEFCIVQLDIRRKSDGKRIFGFESPTQSMLFARRNNVLYIADFSPNASGCFVSALDLDSGRQLWTTPLVGIGPIDRSKYRNRVNIELHGDRVVVFGNESNGRYVEVLNATTGELVSNKQLLTE
jgi:hypothetical protein